MRSISEATPLTSFIPWRGSYRSFGGILTISATAPSSWTSTRLSPRRLFDYRVDGTLTGNLGFLGINRLLNCVDVL